MANQDFLSIAKNSLNRLCGLTDYPLLSVYICLYAIADLSMGNSFIRMSPPDLNIQPIRVSAGIPPYISPAPVSSTTPDTFYKLEFYNNFTTLLWL